MATEGGSRAKIKHIAVATQDPETTAQFYKVPAAKNADPEQFVAYKIAREIEVSGFVKRLYEK